MPETAAAKSSAADKAGKSKKPKIVRDSFTIPKAEYAVLQALKDRAAGLGHVAKKSELLRAGIQTLSAMTDGVLLTSLKAVRTIKTGRPKTVPKVPKQAAKPVVKTVKTTSAAQAPAKAKPVARKAAAMPAAKKPSGAKPAASAKA